MMNLDENGERKLSNGGEDLLVFPPQAVVPAGGTQVFRVQWAGEPMLDKSKSYLLSITQVPVKLAPTQSSVQVVVSFGVVVNVAPPQGSPALKLIATGVVTDKQGERHPRSPSRINAGPRVIAECDHTTIRWKLVADFDAGHDQYPDRHRARATGKAPPGDVSVDLPADVKTIQASVEMTTKRP